jgi:hypothetical protein
MPQELIVFTQRTVLCDGSDEAELRRGSHISVVRSK